MTIENIDKIENISSDSNEIIYIIDNNGQIREVSKKYIEDNSENVFIVINKAQSVFALQKSTTPDLYDNMKMTSLENSEYNNDLSDNNVTGIYLYKDNIYYADDKISDEHVMLKCVGCCCIFLFIFIAIWLLNLV